MKTKNLAFLGLLGAAGISSLAFAPSAGAVALRFTFQSPGASLTGGGNLTGSFDFDTAVPFSAASFSNTNITSTSTDIADASPPIFDKSI